MMAPQLPPISRAQLEKRIWERLTEFYDGTVTMVTCVDHLLGDADRYAAGRANAARLDARLAAEKEQRDAERRRAALNIGAIRRESEARRKDTT